MLSDHHAHFAPEFERNPASSEKATPGEELTLLLEYFGIP